MIHRELKKDDKKYKSFEEYKKFHKTRKGSPTKEPINFTTVNIYNYKERKEKTNIINLVCKKIRQLIVKGHDITFPYIGTLTHDCNLKAEVTAEGEDYRTIDFEKFLNHEYNKSDFDENPKYSGNVMIHFFLKKKSEKHTKKYIFIPNKYLPREMSNYLFGTNYKILR